MAKSNSLGQSQATSSADGMSADAAKPLSETEQVDFCWRVIQRYDGYINATNSKAAIVLTFNSFVFAAVVLKWAEISQYFGQYPIAACIAAVLLLICAFAAVFSLWFGLTAIAPVLSSPKEPKKYHSLVFFGHVAEYSSPEEYFAAVRSGTPVVIAEDLAKQVHALAKIASSKFGRLTCASRLIVFVQLPAFLLMILTLVIVVFLKTTAGGQP